MKLQFIKTTEPDLVHSWPCKQLSHWSHLNVYEFDKSLREACCPSCIFTGEACEREYVFCGTVSICKHKVSADEWMCVRSHLLLPTWRACWGKGHSILTEVLLRKHYVLTLPLIQRVTPFHAWEVLGAATEQVCWTSSRGLKSMDEAGSDRH